MRCSYHGNTPNESNPALQVENFRIYHSYTISYQSPNIDIVKPEDFKTRFTRSWPCIFPFGSSTCQEGIEGTYDDGFNGTSIDHIWVSIRRNSDSKWWNGSQWGCYTKLPATFQGNIWKFFNVPKGLNLDNGSYRIFASVHKSPDANGGPATESATKVTFEGSSSLSQPSSSEDY